MARTRFLWIRFCPRSGPVAEILRAEQVDDRLVVHATLTVPATPWDEFSAAVAGAIRAESVAGHCRCVVDLAHCTWLNSEGVGALIAWYQLAARSGGRLVLAQPNERVRNVLAVTRLDQVFAVHGELAAAVADLVAAA